ncbi:MAG: helix-turn-helix transcriptional regulator, partial [Treponema sp.]|nr:helix-turn-helix transcriptional regulator [Treponema sp.]
MKNEQNTQKQILEISIRLFAEKGYDSVGIQEICNEASVTKPTLYY